jgi:hypothetical protein
VRKGTLKNLGSKAKATLYGWNGKGLALASLERKASKLDISLDRPNKTWKIQHQFYYFFKMLKMIKFCFSKEQIFVKEKILKSSGNNVFELLWK